MEENVNTEKSDKQPKQGGKLKLFLENFLVYGVGGIISKVIPLIMVPIVTRLLPTTELFGVSDLSNMLISLASALAIMGMYDAMYRMFFEKEDVRFQKEICSTALIFTMGTSLVIFALLMIFAEPIGQWMFTSGEYGIVVYISAMATLVGATNSIIFAPTRMQNKRGTFLILNALGPILSYAIAIPMLLAGYYVIALPLSFLISNVVSEVVFLILNRKWFSFRLFRKKHLKPLLLIAVPLIPNFLVYWLFNSADRLMITQMIGLGQAGVYSVSSKLGHVSQLIYTAFSGGWLFFAFSTMKEKDQVKSNSKIFEYLGIISFVSTAFVFALSLPIFKLLFEEEYWGGYIAAPYLFLAPLLQMLFQVAANQFLVVKKTWPNFFILFFGVAVNVVLNFFLIPILGIEGAAIATMVGYAISDIICVIVLRKMKLMVVSWRFLTAVALLTAYIVVWRLFFSVSILFGVLLALALTAIIVLLYFNDIKTLFHVLKRKKAQPVAEEGKLEAVSEKEDISCD